MRLFTIGKGFGEYFIKHRRIPPLRGGFRALLNPFQRKRAITEYPQWFSANFEMRMRMRERWCELMKVPEKCHAWYPDAHSLLNAGYWPEVLEREDAEWIRVPVESRSPFLDHRLLRFLLRVPPVPLCIGKELLRRAMIGVLPEEVCLRPKVPLAGDPLILQLRSGKWSLLPLPQATASVRSFVNWDRFNQVLVNKSEDSLSRDVRALLLNHWLKDIEKNGEIK
jgi:asparagine synthase (glutamine-hydrolysing)